MYSDPGFSSRLRITEIFLSLQGEARDSGRLTTFVRLTGCPLRCGYCDTAYAFHGGEWRTIDEVIAQVRANGAHHVCVTGGEPLAQKRCIELLQEQLLPNCNVFCYGQVRSAYGSGQFKKDLDQKFATDERMITSEIPDRDGILKSIKDFLGKGR